MMIMRIRDATPSTIIMMNNVLSKPALVRGFGKDFWVTLMCRRVVEESFGTPESLIYEERSIRYCISYTQRDCIF